MDAATDPYRFVLEQPMAATPGTRWQYNNGSAEVVGGILQKATGHPLDQFAKEALFEPLGITDWERDAATVTSGRPADCRCGHRSHKELERLILDHGTWRRRRIVGAPRIQRLTEPPMVNPTNYYGYFSWHDRNDR